MRDSTALVASLILLLVAAISTAEPTSVPAFSLSDQYGQSHDVDEETRAILFTRDMGAGDIVKGALADAKGSLLARAGAVYIADVSPMPAIIRRVFAIPAMRRRGYPILLDRDGSRTKSFPHQKGAATLLLLDRLRISRILHIDSPAELQSALQSARPSEEAGKGTE